ncbi:hypothetical protein SEPCBS119000_003687 [Sporothrix epigloea]|uniref:Uncharacterized protein n=1 Tax=Sporothrix epigloea TaxID=1892477 RepID=A0ABP0DQ04_9PEZI
MATETTAAAMPWWTMELAVLRSEWRRVDSLYNANLATMDECKLIHNAYRSAVRRAKRDYWEREAVRIEALAAMRYTRLQKKADAVPICHDGVVAEAVADEAAALMTLSRPAPAASCLPPLSNTTTQLSAS